MRRKSAIRPPTGVPRFVSRCCLSVPLSRGVDGGSRCRMSIIRNGNVALSNLRNTPVALSNLKKHPCRPVEFKKHPCRMSLRPKKGRVALSILGVYTHMSVCMSVCLCLKLKLPGMCPSIEQWETVFFSGHNHISC